MEESFKVVLAKKQNEIIDAAQICLKHRLFIEGWQLSRWYREASFNPNVVKAIVIAYVSDNPVAALFVYTDGVAGIFVKEEERRKGIGTEMVKAFCKARFVPLFTVHDKISKEFFEGIEANINIDYEWME